MESLWFETARVAGLLGLGVSTVLRRARAEGWQSRPRQARGGGSEWLLASMPAATREAISNAFMAHDAPAVTDGATAPVPAASAPAVASPLSSLTAHQRETALARLAFVREIERAAALIGKEKAIRNLLKAGTDGSLAPRLAELIRVANDRYGDGSKRSLGLSRRRLYDWCSLFASGGETALAPRHQGKDMRVPAWAPAFLAVWQQPQKPALADAYRQFASGFEGSPPSIHAVRRLLPKIALPDREAGRATGNALLKLRPHRRRDTSELWPGDVYTADGTTFDAEIQHPIHGQPFKPEVTLVIDLATRRCVGVSMGLAESAFTVLDALRMACLFGGIPAILYVDNGSGYKNKMMLHESTGMLTRLGIEMRNSIPGRPQGKGLMERAVQTITVSASKRLVSCTHADMDTDAGKKVFKIGRAQLKAAGRSKLLPSWDVFKQTLLARIEEYNASPHRGLPRIEDAATGRKRHLSPDEAWSGFEARNWEPVRVPEAIRDELFMPGLPRLVRNAQVQLFGGVYFAAELEDFHGDYVEVRYDVWDASRIHCWTTGGERVCTAVLDGNAIPYFPKSQIEAARDRRQAAQVSRLTGKIARIAPGATVHLPDAPRTPALAADTLSAPAQPAPVALDLPAAQAPAAPARPRLFVSVQERYKWLMRNRDFWTDADAAWIADYARSPDYADLHEYYHFAGIAWDGAAVQARTNTAN